MKVTLLIAVSFLAFIVSYWMEDLFFFFFSFML